MTSSKYLKNSEPVVLELKNFRAGYNHVSAVKELNLIVKRGEMVAILGPNGSGKTTLLRAIGGLKPPEVTGEIIYEGRQINRWSAERRAREGISLVLEGRRIFPGLLVEENLLLGGYSKIRKMGKAWLRKRFKKIFEMFPVLEKKLKETAGSLSGGEQQMLAIAKALIPEPRFLLLDEPSFGLGPKVIKVIFDAVQELRREENLTGIIVEQDALLALKYSDKAIVMSAGNVMLSGTSDELMNDRRILSIYLGGEHR